jgi:folylpolyglutamate synthase/dihydropteroate synthase
MITNINNQHLEWVKPKTLRTICREKVGYLSKKTTIYVGKQEPKTMQIIKKILKKNPSRQVYYGSGWNLKKFGNKRVYKDNGGKIILKAKKILSDGLFSPHCLYKLSYCRTFLSSIHCRNTLVYLDFFLRFF